MKATRFVTLIAAGLALSYFAAGCRPQNMAKIPNRPPEPKGSDVNPYGQLPGATNPTMIELPPFPMHTNWDAHPDILKEQTIHFAFDSSAIRSSENHKLSAVADYLRKNTEAAVRVEGNCDERGTEEYNRSLGERRALAAREHLVGLGIAADRVDTVSYGLDKPVDPGHNEQAWKQNRRDDFVVLTPPAK